MKYKTLFRMLLKATGVFLVTAGVATALHQLGSFLVYIGYSLMPSATWLPRPGPSVPAVTWSLLATLLEPAFQIAAGAYLFFGGRWIVDKAIPGNRPYCPECGHDLTGATRNRCPECGTPFCPEDVAASRGITEVGPDSAPPQ